ncbi:UDP-N-acetylmuramoyl-L-alanyl-D-glutamate--2,6-diaminopimelate ligase [Desulfosarcina sp. BuS5]|uniref:UDP-N-acetylmuramoyl-L-alanyl-D-glutamate--2, 6-diaminopimelate ligase n=1 Tax=Desulfosarcina sp. BuS5 TaxID=933262 RepID=UPI000489838E|nr:UDP-N-acetylmuramoyl-L-alanyl-D-glutamate--2,6-diaminopimelate ligase [Desulfosarcina sp. BuS5]WDN88096.1 UDP-N-acetylmuramoyl-L-alanyl-D-glutamate--2,6-diaminopimelate ligase [Desulfosarcina sp. BuS5]
MKLHDLLKSTQARRIYSDGDSWHEAEISSIHYRAQEVLTGGLFVAVKGLAADGHDFIDTALARGAKAIVTQKPVDADSIIIEVENTRRALARISSEFYHNPSGKLVIIGVTGTNGKTTTAYLIESILLKAGIRAGVIGTINYRYAGKVFNNPMTTPESADLQKIFAEMFEHGITHIVMEVSSHAIDFHRIDCCNFDLGVFTNLTQDHLDFHGDMDTYWLCKKRFFTEILNPGGGDTKSSAVLNCDNKYGRELFEELPGNNISVGNSKNKMVYPEVLKQDLTGMEAAFFSPGGNYKIKSSLAGQYNLENLLCAAGTGFALSIKEDIIASGLEEVNRVPGRIERIDNNLQRFVYVDYAHTPDALGNVLSTLKSLTKQRLICLFGCGGDRDKAKRPLMGEIAAKLSDFVIITSDNPRTEDPVDIINQILSGIGKSSSRRLDKAELNKGRWKLPGGIKGYAVEPDRQKAIFLSVKASLPGDTIVIAGKGHETYQIVGDKRLSFDDREVAKAALKDIR